MAWNPSPKVVVAREYAKKFKQKMVIIIAIDDDNRLSYASYGRDKSLCDNAKQIADVFFDYLEEQYIPFA